MARQSVFDMPFSRVYPMLISKAERKGRTRKEVDEVTSWLTGYSPAQIDEALSSEITYGDFFSGAPAYNPRADLITGKICGIQVETIEDPLTVTEHTVVADKSAKVSVGAVVSNTIVTMYCFSFPARSFMLRMYSYSASSEEMPVKLQFLLSVPFFVNARTDSSSTSTPFFFAESVTFEAL